MPGVRRCSRKPHMKEIVPLILSQIVHYLRDLFRILVRPKRFVRSRNTYSEASLTKSLTFLGISFALYSILLSALLPAGTDFFARTARNALFCLMTAVSQAAALTFSWRIVGGRASFGRQLVTLFYFGGPFLLIFGVLVVFALGVLQSTFPELFDCAKNVIMRGGRDDGGECHGLLVAILSSDRAFQLLFALVPLVLSLVVPWVWIYVGWGAYRELNAVSKTRSFLAGILYILFVVIIFRLFMFVARVIV